MLADLANELHQAREKSASSLEIVASRADISAAYLHKLERGTVDNPSPHVLARLARALDLEYLRLMELAGYLDETQLAEVAARQPPSTNHPLANRQLSTEEWKAVGAFIRYLIENRD